MLWVLKGTFPNTEPSVQATYNWGYKTPKGLKRDTTKEQPRLFFSPSGRRRMPIQEHLIALVLISKTFGKAKASFVCCLRLFAIKLSFPNRKKIKINKISVYHSQPCSLTFSKLHHPWNCGLEARFMRSPFHNFSRWTKIAAAVWCWIQVQYKLSYPDHFLKKSVTCPG